MGGWRINQAPALSPAVYRRLGELLIQMTALDRADHKATGDLIKANMRVHRGPADAVVGAATGEEEEEEDEEDVCWLPGCR